MPDAVIVAVVSTVTNGIPAALTRKVTNVAPDGIITRSGIAITFGRLLLRLTTVPPGGAGLSSVILAAVESPFKRCRDASAKEVCDGGGLNGARPFANGRYRGSPRLIIIHFNQRVFLRKASPTYAPCNRSRRVPPGRTSPGRKGSFTAPLVTLIPLRIAFADQLGPSRGFSAEALSRWSPIAPV